jgi:hypothetical protein
VLKDLDTELHLNYDMFETARGQFKLEDPRLAGLTEKELNRENLSNWGHRYITALLDKRDMDHPDCDLVKPFQEATQIVRSCMVLLKTDKELQYIIAIIWKTIVSHVDMGLSYMKSRLDTAQDRVWQESKKHFEGVIRRHEDTETTLKRRTKELEAEVVRLTKLDKDSSGKEVTLNNGLYELRQMIEDLKD